MISLQRRPTLVNKWDRWGGSRNHCGWIHVVFSFLSIDQVRRWRMSTPTTTRAVRWGEVIGIFVEQSSEATHAAKTSHHITSKTLLTNHTYITKQRQSLVPISLLCWRFKHRHRDEKRQHSLVKLYWHPNVVLVLFFDGLKIETSTSNTTDNNIQ